MYILYMVITSPVFSRNGCCYAKRLVAQRPSTRKRQFSRLAPPKIPHDEQFQFQSQYALAIIATRSILSQRQFLAIDICIATTSAHRKREHVVGRECRQETLAAGEHVAAEAAENACLSHGGWLSTESKKAVVA